MGNCLGEDGKKRKQLNGNQHQTEVKNFIKSKLHPEEIEMLYQIYNDLAQRIPENKISPQNFLLFFHKAGEWGDRLFSQFDADQSSLIDIEQFVKGMAKIFKSDQKQKIRLLYKYFSSNSNYRTTGIGFNELLTMVFFKLLKLYNYPKDGLKRILSNQEFVDHQIRKRLIEVKNQRKLQSIYKKGGFAQSNNQVIQCYVQESQSQYLPSIYGFKNIMKKANQKNKDEGTSIQIKVQGKQIQVKSANIQHLVKKLALSIFRQYDIDIQVGRLSEAQFEAWVLKHKQLYNNYYDGFHNEIWEYDRVGQIPKYLQIKSQKQSQGRTQINGKLEEVLLILVHSTIIVTKAQEHNRPLQMIILDGLAVKRTFNKAYGIEISHRDGHYKKKQFFFKNESLSQQWLELLKFYKGVTITQLYELGRKIGAGKFSVVYEAIQIQTGKQYAIKIIQNANLDADGRRMIAHESSIMAVLTNPFLVAYKQTILSKTHTYIVAELVKGKDLFQYVKAYSRLDEFQAAIIARQLILGVKYMHIMGIVHRDLKPENIMILQGSGDELVKLIDFGFANYLNRLQTFDPEDLYVGTPGYIAPEILNGQQISFKTDNFAIGAIIYFMLSGAVAFNGKSIQQMFQKTLAGNYDFNAPIWRKISEQAKDLIKGFLQFQVQQRITLQDALRHPWFKATNKKNG